MPSPFRSHWSSGQALILALPMAILTPRINSPMVMMPSSLQSPTHSPPGDVGVAVTGVGAEGGVDVGVSRTHWHIVHGPSLSQTFS
jgi:hypothetical protein